MLGRRRRGRDGAGLGAPASRPPRPVARPSAATGPRSDAGADGGWCHRFLLGSGYRDLWATPIESEVLDLDRFSGGLVAAEKGGGKQTRSLTLEGADGREWKFRSIDKDPTSVLPEALQDSFVDKIAQDQISASSPPTAWWSTASRTRWGSPTWTAACGPPGSRAPRATSGTSSRGCWARSRKTPPSSPP